MVDSLGPQEQTQKHGLSRQVPQWTTVLGLADKYDYFLLDCDGVIWSGEEEINQAFKSIEKLESLGKKVFFLSNNATKSSQDSAEKMKRLGYSDPKPDQIFGTAFITAQYM